MTGRERITAAARGGEVDQRPTISAFGAGRADAIAVAPDDVATTIEHNPESAVLANVLSPLGRAIAQGIPIINELHGDIDSGDRMLEELTRATREEAASALDSGADGLFYILDGAYPGFTTPMEYGGHFLEVDRHLLTEFVDARFNVLFVCGKSEPYIDFVSDLPAHAFAWDPESRVDVESVRAMRGGAVAAASEAADFALMVGSEVPA